MNDEIMDYGAYEVDENWEDIDLVEFDDPMELEDFEDNMSDVEADADTLASAGWGMDEDYGYYGDDNDFGDW